MTKITTSELLCDNPLRFHRPIAEVEADVTRKLGWNGLDYEIDLCAADSTLLDQALAEFVKHARRPKPATARKPGRDRSAAARERDAAVRAWAREAGFAVSARGRIPVAAHREYRRVHGG